MSTRPSESLKEVANQLAHLITHGSEDKKKIQALTQELGFDADNPGIKYSPPPSSTSIDMNRMSTRDNRVGIWVPRWIAGKKQYVRDEKYGQEFNDWARIHELPPKSSRKRIVYLGESVSRGYLLDPFYTPASVLETLLNSTPGLLKAEVIDLARNDCNIKLLTELCSSCLALQPDAIVIFAGNNWLGGYTISEDLLDTITRIVQSEERFSGMKPVLEEHCKEVVVSFMKHVDHVSKTYQVPVVYVIPESNLLDFQSNEFQRINLCPRGETGRWLEIKEEIEEALDKENLDKAESLCHEMIELNEGNPFGYELLARCKLKRGLFPEAEEYLRRALDTAIFRTQNVPCCISFIRKTLLAEAAKYKIPVVDLAEVFRYYQDGRPPGRELFLDYCHMTVEGIEAAMTSTAQQLFSILIEKEVPADELRATAVKPGKDVIARSHFFAAIHNAHRGDQPYEILYYHCLKALDESAAIKDLMLKYVEMASCQTVWALTKWCEQMVESGEMSQFPHILQPHNHYIMDIKLVDAIGDALKKHGIDVEERVLNTRKKEHGLVKGKDKINLLESYYHLTSYVASNRPNNSYYRAFAPQSCFFLVAGDDHDLQLELTYRVPSNNLKEARVYLSVNSSLSVELPTHTRWQDFTLEVAGELLNKGINYINLQWPPNAEYKEEDLKQGNTKSRRKLINQIMYPVYGEIYMFTVKKSKIPTPD